MPFLEKYIGYNMWGEVVTHDIKLAVTAGGGVTNYIAPPLDSVVAGGSTGLYTVTMGDAPYVQCVKCVAGLSQATLEADLGVNLIQPVDGTGNTVSIQFFRISTAAATEPTNATIVYLEVSFRQMAVP